MDPVCAMTAEGGAVSCMQIAPQCKSALATILGVSRWGLMVESGLHHDVPDFTRVSRLC
jgi:hypothetical protein